MKNSNNSLILCIIACLIFPALGQGQSNSQQKVWYFNGKALNFTESSPQVEELSAEHQLTGCAANGMHDDNGELLFHVIDNRVYDKEGDLMSEFTNSDMSELEFIENPYAIFLMGQEVELFPVPGSSDSI